MKSIREISKVPGGHWAVGGYLLVILFAAAGVVAQMPGDAAGSGSAKPLEISLEPLYKGERLHDGASVQAPAVIYIFPHLQTGAKPHAGDKVKIDFFANDQKLCSQTAVWQDAKRPPQRRGEAVPMWVMAAQFLVSDCVWSNPAPGSYTLTAHATGLQGLSADAEPMRITMVAAPRPEQSK